jgi:hypothetical protein
MSTCPELHHRQSRPSYLRVHSLRATSCRNIFFVFTATKQSNPIYFRAPWVNDPYDNLDDK